MKLSPISLLLVENSFWRQTVVLVSKSAIINNRKYKFEKG